MTPSATFSTSVPGSLSAPGKPRARPAWIWRFLTHKSTLTLLAIFVLWGGVEVYGLVTRPGRMSPQIMAAIHDGRTVVGLVTLRFEPEQFHMKQLQKYGSPAGVNGRTVTVRRLTPANALALGRVYWVERIDVQ